jgi:hypothetical protein
MNILEAEDIIKGLPDDALMQESEMPTGQLPQFLVVSEIQRRSDMRNRYSQQMQEQPQGTVADQIKQQGIMSMMPQMGMGPQGMPPQGIPPQMMSAGGIVKLANGGQPAKIQALMDALAVGGVTAAELLAQGYTLDQIQAAQRQLSERMSMPVSGMDGVLSAGQIADAARPPQSGYGDQYDEPFIRGFTNVISDKASELASAASRGIESLGIEAQKQMPNYGLVGRNDMDFGGALESAMRIAGSANPVGAIANAAQNLPYGDVADAISSGVAQTPIGRYDAEASQRMRDVYDESGIGAAAGQGVREIPGGLAALAETAISGYAPLGEGARMAAASPIINEPARALEQLVTGSVSENPLTLGGIGERFGSYLYDVFNEGSEPDPVATAVDVVAEEATGVDKSSPTAPPTSQNIGGSERQGAGTEVQSEADTTDSLLRSVMADEPPREMPDFSIADLIADQRRMTQANMLMQLGAGIAGGDVSKGLSAAGMAGMKGSQAEQALALKERLAKYQAGRQDIARAEKADQFERTFGLSEQKLEALIEKEEGVQSRAYLNALLTMYEGEIDPAKKMDLKNKIMREIQLLQGGPMDISGMQSTGSRPSLSSFGG